MYKIIDGQGLTARAVFLADSAGLSLSERDSRLTITISQNVSGLKTGVWLQDLEDPGKGIVWRIKSLDDQKDTGSRTYTCEHTIRTLADRIIPDEITTEAISGGSTATPRQAFQKILSYQSDWQLGTLDPSYDSVHLPYKFDGDTLLAAMETVSKTLEDPIWEYEFGTYPFRLNIRKMSQTADCELRAGRNLSTIKITEDRSQMYTRFYPRGKNNLKLSGSGYVSKNETLYGRIDKTETDQSRETEAELIAWANERLNRHARPGHTVTISGLELSAATGEDLDRLRIGHTCRVPLPDDGETVTEKITKLQWRDKIKDPMGVSVTMADALDDVATIIREEQQKAGGGGRAAAKADEDNTLLIGQVESGLYSAIVQTSTEIMSTVHDELQGYSTITQTATAIQLAVSDASTQTWTLIQQTSTGIFSTVMDEVSGNYSTITQTATSIALAVSSASTDIYGAIEVQKDRISLVVSGSGDNARIRRAQIVLAINNGTSSATISADEIDIDGLVTSLEAKDVMVQHFNAAGGEFTEDLSVLGDLSVAGDTSIQALECTTLTVESIKGHTVSWKNVSVPSLTYGTYRYYLYGTSTSSTTASGATGMYPITGQSSTTIYYLGHS